MWAKGHVSLPYQGIKEADVCLQSLSPAISSMDNDKPLGNGAVASQSKPSPHSSVWRRATFVLFDF